MKNIFFRNQKLIGLLLCILGLVVIAGWLSGNPSLVKIVPGSVAMGFNTALMFVASGICLFFSSEDRPALIKILAGFLILLPTLILLEHAFDVDLGIDLRSMHAAIADANTRPGRVAPNTCLAFLLAGCTFLLQRENPSWDGARRAATALIVAVLAIGGSAFVGYVLHLEAMYQIATYNRMAAPTAAAITLLGIGLFLRDRSIFIRIIGAFEQEDRKIVRLMALMLAVLALAAGITGFAVLRQGFERSAAEGIEVRAKNNATIISYLLEQGQLLAKSLVLRPALRDRLKQLSDHPDDQETLELVRTVGATLLEHEFSGVQFFNGHGKLLVTSGRLEGGSAALAFPLRSADGAGLLVWHDGSLLLRSRNHALLDGEIVGTIVTEQRLTALTSMLVNLQSEGRSSDAMLCGKKGDALVCFPGRFYKAERLDAGILRNGGANMPLLQALDGKAGSLTGTDRRGVTVLAGHAPVPGMGMELLMQTDMREVYAPLREKLDQIALLLLLFVAIGTLGLRKIVQPLIERIVAEQNRISVILKNSNDAFVALAADGVITDWNAQAERTFGWNAADAIGRDLAELIIPEGQRGAHRKGYRQFMRTGTGPVLNKRLEVTAVHRNGHEIPVELSIASFFDGRNFIASAFLRDISERRAAEKKAAEQAEALEQSRQALIQSQKLEAVGKLTGGIAHDFNNVLQIISGSLQLVQLDANGQPRIEKFTKTALDAVQRGATLSMQLLAFARRQPLQPVPVNLGQLLRKMDGLLQRALGAAVRTETVVAGGLWSTAVDPAQLEHVVLNLAINARDAMNGAGKLTIEVGNAVLDDDYVRAEPGLTPGQYVVLAISDTGSGMSPDTIERAFEPFFTTKPEGQGTGLGLSMAYGFTKQSGGHIRIYSELGHGTTIRVYLPRTFEQAVERSAPQPDAMPHGTETILVVEDDLSVQETVVEALLSLGYQVLRADNCEAALDIIKSGASIDLLFSDVVMPGAMRSPELAREAKILIPTLRVLYTSGYTQNAIVHGGRLDPGVELLSKPYRREQLAQKIRMVLSRKE